MATRMERYKNNAVKSSRSSRNKNLYNTMYNFEKYSNISGVASMEGKNEIDISKVKKMLDSQENKYSNRKYRNSDRETYDDIPLIRKRYTEDTNRSYDIMDVLKEAREKKEPDNKERVLDNTNYDVLKKLKLQRDSNIVEADKSDIEKKEDLKDLIETISNTSMLNKINDEELATDMFSDLISDDTKVGELNDVTEFIESSEKSIEKTMDDSFFTGKIKKADFVGGDTKKGSTVKAFFITLFVILIVGGGVIFALYYFGVIK